MTQGYVGAKLQLDCGPSLGTFIGTIVEVSDEKLTLKHATRNGQPSDTNLVTLHRSSIVGITMLRSACEESIISSSSIIIDINGTTAVKDKENRTDHRVIEASLQSKTEQIDSEQKQAQLKQKQQQARREAVKERLMSIPNATPVYICQSSPVCPAKGGGGCGGPNGHQNGRRKGDNGSFNGPDVTIASNHSVNSFNCQFSPPGRRVAGGGGVNGGVHHQHIRARSELVSNHISYGNNNSAPSINTHSPPNSAAKSSSTDHWFVANGDTDLRVPAVSEAVLESVLQAAEKLGLSMARMAEACGRSVADFLICRFSNNQYQQQHHNQHHYHHRLQQQQQQHQLQFAVIIGGGRRGQLGLAVARHLANRGASVHAYITATSDSVRDVLGAEIRLYRSTGCPLVEHSRDLPWLLDCILLASDQVDSPSHPLAQWFRACRAPLACLAPLGGDPACLSPRYNLHCCLPLASKTSSGGGGGGSGGSCGGGSAAYLCDLGVTRDAFQAAGIRDLLLSNGANGFISLFSRGSVVQLSLASAAPTAAAAAATGASGNNSHHNK